MALSPAARSKGLRLEVFDRLGSTNDEAGERVRTGDPGGLSDHGPRAGGRTWPPRPRLAVAAGQSLREPAAGEPVFPGHHAADALRRRRGGPRCRVAAGGIRPGPSRAEVAERHPSRSCSFTGILVEGAVYPGGPAAVIVGCGINLRHFPPDTPYPATSLADQGIDISPDTAIAVLADAMDEALDTWQGGANPGITRRRWLAQARSSRQSDHRPASRRGTQRHLRRSRQRWRAAPRGAGAPHAHRRG